MARSLLTFYLILQLIASNLTAQSTLVFSNKIAKIATLKEGVYKVTGEQFKKMGFDIPMASEKINLFYFDLLQLQEQVPKKPSMGWEELAIEVVDGGDQTFNETDYFLFYANGPNKWEFVVEEQAWKHRKIAIRDTVFFYLTFGEIGKRIQKNSIATAAVKTITYFEDHLLIEKDTINYLNSGKLWLGAPLKLSAGKPAEESSNLNLEGVLFDQPIFLRGQYAAAAYQSNGNFGLYLNDNKIRSITTTPVSGLYFFDAFSIATDTARILLNEASIFSVNKNKQASNFKINFTAENLASTGYLDYVELHVKRKIGFWGNGNFFFNHTEQSGSGKTLSFQIENATPETLVWDISTTASPVALTVKRENNTIFFKSIGQDTKYYTVFNKEAVSAPIFIELLSTQSVSSDTLIDYIIVAATDFLPAGKKLQDYHVQQHKFKVKLVDAKWVYENFSGGQTDPIAIRNYVKYLINQSKEKSFAPPRYLVLLGMGNYDPRNINTKTQLPVFQSSVSNAILNSYGSDDFYAILKEGDHIERSQKIDSLLIAVGRIPSRNIAEADTMIQKVIHYQTSKKAGPWQNNLTWIADDGDYNLHLQDAEEILSNLKSKSPKWNVQKIYLDLFTPTKKASGNVFTLVNEAINQAVNAGTLVLNYTGHGNFNRLAEEAVITKTEMETWNNMGAQPLMITASCDFAPYDKPALFPIGFESLMGSSKGIIALVAANRLVFASSNKQINDAYVQALLVPNKEGVYASIGEALRIAKNNYFNQNGDRLNAFKFSLLGDPAMFLAQPKGSIKITAVNTQKANSDSLFLEAGTTYTMNASVYVNENKLTQFDGEAIVTLLDGPKSKKTLAGQITSTVTTVQTQEQILFSGKATVKNGVFTIRFVLPKSLVPSENSLRLTLYASSSNEQLDAIGLYENIFIRSINTSINTDTLGPQIKSYINHPNFKSGDWVSLPANLVIALKDSTGIQSAGSALGQDIRLIIDDAIQNPIVLNNFFTTNIDSYQSGSLNYPLPTLSPGIHKLTIKAWDILGNANRDTLFFEVAASENLLAKGVTNYPNPFKNQTRFTLAVSAIKETTIVTLEILDLEGRQIYRKKAPFELNANRILIEWDGKTTDGSQLSPGVYYYRFLIQEGKTQTYLSNKFIKL